MAFFLFEDDPLSQRRKQDALIILGVIFFPVLIGVLYFGQDYLDKNRTLSIEQKTSTETTAASETNSPTDNLARARWNPGDEPSLLTRAPTDSSSTSKSGPAAANNSHSQASAEPGAQLLREATQLVGQKKYVVALEKANAAIQAAPQSSAAYCLRGDIYGEQKRWDEATKDFQTALQLDGKSSQAKFGLAEILFQQKKYDDARSGFVILQKDPVLGDLATYKVFLCDLFASHEDIASKELDAFNQVGSDASYYFANGAWSLYHQKTEDARGWLNSAENIYNPNKFRIYATSLIDLGYLPLPPPPEK